MFSLDPYPKRAKKPGPLLIYFPLKRPKLEIFVAEFFTQSKPVWVDDLGTRK
jgi:hypothetical protein